MVTSPIVRIVALSARRPWWTIALVVALAVCSGIYAARHFTIKGKFSQDVWYDNRGRLVQSQLVGKDGSIIIYKLI